MRNSKQTSEIILNGMRIVVIIIVAILIAGSCSNQVSAAQDAPDDGWWGDIVILNPRGVVTYRHYFNMSSQWLILYSGWTSGYCHTAAYFWNGVSWETYVGGPGSVKEGDTYLENGTFPRLRCVWNGEWYMLTVYSDSLVAPKVRMPNPAWPMTFTGLLRNWGIVP